MLYKISGKITVSCWTEVEAESLEEALEEAEFRDMADINIDGSHPVTECWHMEVDGVPFDVREEE